MPERVKILDNDTLNLWVIILRTYYSICHFSDTEFSFSFIFFPFSLPIQKQRYVKHFLSFKWQNCFSSMEKFWGLVIIREIWATVTLSWYTTGELYCKCNALMQSKSKSVTNLCNVGCILVSAIYTTGCWSLLAVIDVLLVLLFCLTVMQGKDIPLRYRTKFEQKYDTEKWH